MLDEIRRDVVGKLPGDFRLPFRQKSLRIERRKLFLDLVREMEIERMLVAALAIAQHGRRLPRVVIAIVEKENERAADRAWEPPGCDDFREEESFWKKTARLLAEADDRRGHCVGASLPFRNTV